MPPTLSRFIPGSSILPQPMNEHRFNSKHISDSTIRIVAEKAGGCVWLKEFGKISVDAIPNKNSQIYTKESN